MKDCEAVLKDLFEYLDKEMDEKSCAEIKEHMDLCRMCFDRAEFEKMLRQHIKEKTNHCCPDALKQRIQKLIDKF